jgi:drug/metabolite transporter (DMT)-like permease
MPDLAPKWKIAVAMGLVYVIWGSTYLAIRFAVQTLPPLTMSGVRFLLAGGALWAWSALRGGPRGARVTAAHWRSAVVIGLLLFLCGNGFVVVAEKRVESGLAALLVSTTPLFIVLLPWLLRGGKRPTLPVVLGILLGLAGVGLLVRPGAVAGSGGVDLWGALLLSAASLTWAAGSLYSAQAALPASPLLSTGIQMFMGGALMLAAGGLFGEFGQLDLAHASTPSLLGFGYLVIAALVAFTAYLWLLRVANPLVAVLLGWAIAGEPLTARTAVAGLVIVSGVALITINRTAKAKKPVTEEPAVPAGPALKCEVG